jgi:hypothetical protein
MKKRQADAPEFTALLAGQVLEWFAGTEDHMFPKITLLEPFSM